MKYALVSFDLQGTLSDSQFSDNFWLNLLPTLWARKKGMELEYAQEELKSFFKKIGIYDYRYYATQYWLNQLDMRFSDIKRELKEPVLFLDMLELLKEVHEKTICIVTSSTTHEFIDCEIQEARTYCKAVFSSLDDFNMSGKPPELFKAIAKKMGVLGPRIHIGDSLLMDVENAQKAGWDAYYFDPSIPRTIHIERLRKLLL